MSEVKCVNEGEESTNRCHECTPTEVFTRDDGIFVSRHVELCPLHAAAEEMLRLLEESDSVTNDCHCKRCVAVKAVIEKARAE